MQLKMTNWNKLGLCLFALILGCGSEQGAEPGTVINPNILLHGPTNVQAQADSSGGRIHLLWSNYSSNGNSVSNVVQRRLSSESSFTDIVTLDGSMTAYSDNSGLALDRTYVYRIKVIGGLSRYVPAYSDEAFVLYSSVVTTPLPGSAPSAPAYVDAEGYGSFSVELSIYDSSNNETYFEIVREKISSFGGVESVSILEGNYAAHASTGMFKYVDEFVSLGTYRYKVRAGNSHGVSAYTESSNIVVDSGLEVE